MILETQRLLLQPMSRSDHALFHSTNTDEFVRKYLWDDAVISPDLSSDILKAVEGYFEAESRGLWKVRLKNDGAYIGYVGLWEFFDEGQPQLLYALLQEYTGNGYAFEAAREIICYAFEHLAYSYLIASMDKGNESSVRLCRRLGFSFVEETVIDGSQTCFYRISAESFS